MRKREKPMKKRNDKLPETILLCLCVVIFCFSVWKLYGIFKEYRSAAQEYEAISKQYVQEERPAVKTAETKAETEELLPDFTVDFDGLEAVNPDLYAWLEFPLLEISYPVVQSEDDSYYLTHTFDKTQNSCGAIFTDSQTAGDLSDLVTVLYGHNMKNGSMFGSLKKLMREENFCDENPYFYICTRDRIRQYRIAGYQVTQEDSDVYQLPGDLEAYGNYRKNLLAASLYHSAETLPGDAPMVVLSTCYGKSGGTSRMIVYGVLTAEQNVSK